MLDIVRSTPGGYLDSAAHCHFASIPCKLSVPAVHSACLFYFKHTTYTLASSCRSVAVKKLPGIAAPSESLTEVCFLSAAGAEVAGLAGLFAAVPSLSRPRREPTRARPSRKLDS